MSHRVAVPETDDELPICILHQFNPWEDASNIRHLSKSGWVARRARSQVPFSKALDIGTGSGIWGIELAKRGWQVAGIDFVRRH
jgi:2-polyprenyl-3-methyl-5-hydroxy-6-metoxy-1,4-benzoquinol methylase